MFKVWYDAVRQRPSVRATLVDEKELIRNYSNYADGTATSDVAQRFGNGSTGADAVVNSASQDDLVVMNEQDYNGGYEYNGNYL